MRITEDFLNFCQCLNGFYQRDHELRYKQLNEDRIKRLYHAQFRFRNQTNAESTSLSLKKCHTLGTLHAYAQSNVRIVRLGLLTVNIALYSL